MAFKSGDPKPDSSGRKKGTPNKKSFNAKIIAEEYDLDPLIFLLRVLNNDWKGLGFTSQFKVSKDGKKVTKTAHITFRMRFEAATALMKYLYSEAPEQEGDSPSEESGIVTLAYNLNNNPRKIEGSE